MTRVLATLVLTLSLTNSAFGEPTKESHSHYEKALQAMAQEDLVASFIHVKNALQLDPGNLSYASGELTYNSLLNPAMMVSTYY